VQKQKGATLRISSESKPNYDARSTAQTPNAHTYAGNVFGFAGENADRKTDDASALRGTAALQSNFPFPELDGNQ